MTTHPTRREHAARVLLHRWFAFNEREERSIPEQLETMREDVLLHTTYGEGRGHAAILAMLASLPAGHGHAHHIQSFSHRSKDDATSELSLDLVYEHRDPSGHESKMPLHYEVVLAEREDALPQFKSIDIRATGKPEGAPWKDAYPDHRARSAFHYWLFLFELNRGDIAPFKELLPSNGFRLSLGADRVFTELAQFEAYFAAIPPRISLSCHHVQSLEVTVQADGKYALHAAISWEGANAQGQAMVGRTDHRWILSETGAKYPRVDRIDVVAVEPFTVKS